MKDFKSQFRNLKTTEGTLKKVRKFNRENIDMENTDKDTIFFLKDVEALLELQLRKRSSSRMSMEQIIERSENSDYYIMQAGAISIEREIY